MLLRHESDTTDVDYVQAFRISAPRQLFLYILHKSVKEVKMTQQQVLLPANATPNQQVLPAAAEGLGPADIQRLRQSLDSSVSENTRKMYASAWRSFQAWTQGRGNLSLPASPPLVAAYLAHLAEERNLSVATIRLHKAALAAVHKTHGHDDPTDHEGVHKTMKGIGRTHGRTQRQAKPLTAEALAAVRATANTRRPLGDGKKQESAERASWRGRVDLALLSVLRDGLLRRSEAHLLTWADVEFRNNGTALLQLRRSKTDQEGEGVVLYIGKQAAEALRTIRPSEELLDLQALVFSLPPQQIGRRVDAAAKDAGLGEGFTGHSGRVGMAQDLANTGAELPALMTAGRWKNSKMPARYTERQAAGRGAVAKYYQEGEN